MPMAQIKTEEERARLDAIFAEIEAENRAAILKDGADAEARTQEEISEENRRAKIDRLASLECKEFLGNVKANIGNGAFTTKWEKILSQFVVNTIQPMNAELNVLRNFAQAVSTRLEKAEKAAREQDNHHYYKIFAEGVKALLQAL